MIAIHAFRSYSSVRDFNRKFPDRPVVVALAGTDIYDKIRTEPNTIKSLTLAHAIVALQQLAIMELPAWLRGKAIVIHQSAVASKQKVVPLRNSFEISLLSHLRPVKDPLLAAKATRLLPSYSRIRVTHAGKALSAAMKTSATRESADNPRYNWVGEVSPSKAKMILKRSRLMVVTSLLEGGSNVVSEALASGVPVISTRIPGSIGMLGRNYPGYFPVGNHKAMAEMMSLAESDRTFYRLLKKQCAARAQLFKSDREKKIWDKLLGQLANGTYA